MGTCLWILLSCLPVSERPPPSPLTFPASSSQLRSARVCAQLIELHIFPSPGFFFFYEARASWNGGASRMKGKGEPSWNQKPSMVWNSKRPPVLVTVEQFSETCAAVGEFTRGSADGAFNTEPAVRHDEECSATLKHHRANKGPTLCSKSAASQKGPHKARNEPPTHPSVCAASY